MDAEKLPDWYWQGVDARCELYEDMPEYGGRIDNS